MNKIRTITGVIVNCRGSSKFKVCSPFQRHRKLMKPPTVASLKRRIVGRDLYFERSKAFLKSFASLF